MFVSVVGGGFLADAIAQCCDEVGLSLCDTSEADVVWYAKDMPTVNDESDVDAIIEDMAYVMPLVAFGVPVLISTQVPIGFCRQVEALWPDAHFAIQPENVRKATPVDDFRWQDRMVCGTRHTEDEELIAQVLSQFTDRVIFMTPESAEMVKLAINAYLGMSISFANELADVCVKAGADPDEVIWGLRSEGRVSQRAPLKPGGPFTSGSLERDLTTLENNGGGPLLRAIKASNNARLHG